MSRATPTQKTAARKHSEGGQARTCPECKGVGKLHILKADFGQMPPDVQQLIEQGAYSKVSAEVYDEPADGVPGTGCMLRRVAFLGGAPPQIKSLADIPRGSGGNVKGVEIFAAGVRKGRAYSSQHLDQMVENFNRFSAGAEPLQRVPAVLGHEEDQDVLDNTGLPALAWCEKLYREDKPCPACGGKGAVPFGEGSQFAPAFARVVLRLAEIRPGKTAGTYHVFSEVTTVTREEMLAKLQEWGFDPALFGPEVPDATLAEIIGKVEAKLSAATPAPAAPAPADGQMSDGAAAAVATPAQAQAQARQPAQVIMKYVEDRLPGIVEKVVASALAKAQKPVTDKIAQLDKFAEDRLAAEKRASIKARLDALVQQGKVLPAEIDGGLAEVLFTMDAATPRKFSEAGKEVSRTPLDHQFAILEARPVLAKFAERVKAGQGGAGTASDELAKVQRFSEEPRFQPVLKAKGETPQGWAAKFAEAQKKNPALTAEQFGVPASYAV